MNPASHLPDKKNTTHQLVAASLFTALTAAGAFIRVPFPLAPITLQTLVTLLAGSVLAPRYALMSQLVYLVIGLMGLPVFANGGGPAYVLQPTFGYLASLPLAAWLIARLQTSLTSHTHLLIRFSINLAGAIMILLVGAIWLYINIHYVIGKPLSITTILTSGFIIFLPGEMIKAAVATWLGKYIHLKQ